MINFAIQTAREAGAIIQDFAMRRFEITHKGRINIVTEADLAAEKHIKEMITAKFPDHQILAEESGASAHTTGDYRWIIDPLDGTTNFAHGLPCYAVSIGLEYKGEIILGVVFDCSRNELFAAERGSGATMNGEKINVSSIDQLEQSLLVTGFPYDVRERMNFYTPAWEAFLSHSQGVRRLGSAALDMCYVASGRFEGFWEWGLHAWDAAAAQLIVEEAGGKITKTDGSTFDLFVPDVLCSNALVHEQMISVIQDAKLPLQ
jgi:myo-inositol-1(or 4)-monophosphatase